MNRRTFLKSVAATSALAASNRLWAGSTPDNQKTFSLALVGCGWWGTNILTAALASNRCKVVALCDPDPAQARKCATTLKLSDVKQYKDYRELLKDQKPDIIINATPDHWHALITIDALKSDAHVYVEKPLSHTILEGAAMVKTARDTGKVVQVGIHRRLSPHNISAREFIQSGKLGKIGMARAFVNYGGGAESSSPNADPPPGMDWDLWCGPAPLRSFNPKIHPKGFRQFLDYANGQIGDWGVHWLDQILWVMNLDHPTTISSTGSRIIRGQPVNDTHSQTSDAPDHQVAMYSFDDGFTATWEHRMFGGNGHEKGENVGVYFFGTEGVLHLGWQTGWTFYPSDGRKASIHQPAQLHEPNSDNVPESFADFLQAIDQNKRPACDIEIAHRSTTCALLGMLSLKLGRQITWTGSTIANDLEAQKLLRRDYRAGWQYPT